MDKEELSCSVCDSEFAIEHYEGDDVAFCPFCGEQMFTEDLDEEFEDDDWADEDE